jgi:hypothetical protein
MKTVLSYLLSVSMIISVTRASLPPKIRHLEVPKASIGGEALLVCSLDSGTKPIQFIWTKDGKEVSSNLVTNIQTISTVAIPVVKIQDRGIYTCKAKSTFGEDVKSANLVISGELLRNLLVSNAEIRL